MTIAVITGAGSGMGRACVERLRGHADVLLAADLRTPEIDGAIGVACDISDPAAVRKLAAQARESGPFRALVHAAGISPTMGDARRVLEIDLLGTELLLDAFEELVAPGSAAVCFSSRQPTGSRPSSPPRWSRCSEIRSPATSSNGPRSWWAVTAALPTRWRRSG